MAPEVPNDVILYWYPQSPYSWRVYWYLLLRRIRFASCIQPNILPRPDLEALNVEYRRIPILSIGKDIYLDSRHILSKLETVFPDGAIGARTPEHRLIQKLLDRWTTEGSVFGRVVQLIPADAPMMRDPKFLEDRAKGGMKVQHGEANTRMRPEAIAAIKDCFQILERTILADGRAWVFGGENPTLGDIEAIWPFNWLMKIPRALPTTISEETFPKVFAWVARFNAIIKDIEATASVSSDVKGKDVLEYVQNASFAEAGGDVDKDDSLGLNQGEAVEVYPIDYGYSHKDRGELLSLTSDEVVITKRTTSGDEIRVHAPRWGYRIKKVKGDGLPKI